MSVNITKFGVLLGDLKFKLSFILDLNITISSY